MYRFTSRMSAQTVQRKLESAGWRCFTIDGRDVTDKASFLEAGANAMEFPGYCGKNWDGFEECLRDLSWAPAQGYVVLYEHADIFKTSSPRAWETVMDVFRDAVESWRKAGTPMYVLLRNTHAILPTL